MILKVGNYSIPAKEGKRMERKNMHVHPLPRTHPCLIFQKMFVLINLLTSYNA